MAYLYGDATPFPLDENFVETLSMATDACVALFLEETAEHERRTKLRKAQKDADRALASLDALEEAVEHAVDPVRLGDRATSTSDETADRIAQAAQQTLSAARAEAVRKADALIASLKIDLPEKIREAVADFFIRRQLPHTRWTFRWKVEPGSQAVEAQVGAVTPSQIQLKFEAQVPPGSSWAGALRVADFAPQLAVVMQREEGVFRRKSRMRKEPLYRHFITDIDYAPGRQTMILRLATKKPGPGLETLVDSDRSLVAVRPVDEYSEPLGETLQMTGESAEGLTDLAGRIAGMSDELIRCRRKLVSVRLEEDPVAELDEPGLLAERILHSIAPIVREMRVRSRVPGELALKRDMGDGRREELFVPRVEIHRKFAGLPDHQRRAFEAMGLGTETTADFLDGPTREYMAPEIEPAPELESVPELESTPRPGFGPDARSIEIKIEE